MNQYKEICNYYRIQRLESKREDFVDEFLELEQEKVWDAYLSIDVCAKNGNEKVPHELSRKLKATCQSVALDEYFNNCGVKEVYLTDDIVRLDNEYDFNIIKSLLDIPEIKNIWERALGI